VLDDVDVEAVALEQLIAPFAVEHDPRQLGSRLVDRRPAQAVDVLRDTVRREDRQPFLSSRDEDDHQPRRTALLGIRERGLVAMVSVRDQELRIGEVRRLAHTPQAVATALEIGLA
jgi:hypothetical protein